MSPIPRIFSGLTCPRRRPGAPRALAAAALVPAIATLSLAALLAASPAAAAPRPAPQEKGSAKAGDSWPTRIYRVQHIKPMDAIMVAHQICLAELTEQECRHAMESQNWFSYTTRPAMHDKIAAALARADVQPPSLDLRIVLLVAGPEEAPAPKLPDAEARALADVQKILPYKGYKLLQAGLVRTRDRANLRMGQNPSYEAQVELDWPQDPAAGSVQVRRFGLVRHSERRVRQEAAQPGGTPGAEWERINEEVLATRFTLEIGETVVVGTSRLDGDDRALIVLLTAKP